MVPALTEFALRVLLLTLLAGDVRLDHLLAAGGTDDWYQYDDGTACWLSWGGLYRGVWFDVNDFAPGGGGCLTQMQYWFYHHAGYPWDTASFYSELWTGEAGGPDIQLDQTSVAAIHYAPCQVGYGLGITAGSDFWGIVNTEMSMGGWPSLLGDDTPNPTGCNHSFYSEDFIVWEPWSPDGSGGMGLEQETWGSVKTLFERGFRDGRGGNDYLIRFEMLWGGRIPTDQLPRPAVPGRSNSADS